jgi:hypothetical protein
MPTLHEFLSTVSGSFADVRRLSKLQGAVKKTPDSVSTREYTRILKELELAHNEALKAYHIDQLESEFIRTSTDPIDQVKQASDPERDLANPYEYPSHGKLSIEQGQNAEGRPTWGNYSLGGCWGRKKKRK